MTVFKYDKKSVDAAEMLKSYLTRLGHRFDTQWVPGYLWPSSSPMSKQDIVLGMDIHCLEIVCTHCQMEFEVTQTDNVEERFVLWHGVSGLARVLAKNEPYEMHVNCDHNGKKMYKTHPCVCSRLNIML